MSLARTKIDKLALIDSGHDYIAQFTDPNTANTRPPSVVSYCLAAGISKSRLYELQSEIPELAAIVDHIEMLQEQFALDQGYNGRNSSFAAFILKSKSNYHDSPQALTQNNNFNISPDLLSDALKLMNESKK